jgi:hypothetical protein
MRKIYRAIRDFSYFMYIEVEGVERSIDFNRGFKSNAGTTNGFFATSDAKLQKALESDPRFNVTYSLEKTTVEPKVEAPKEDPKKDFKQLTSTNKQMAIEELTALFPELETISPNITNANLEALANTKECTFPNLKIS